MRNVRLIARRELLERIRKTGYRVTTIGGLLLIGVLFFMPTISDAIENSSRKTVAVVDPQGSTVAQLRQGLPERAPNGQPTLELRRVDTQAQAERLVRTGDADGRLTLGSAPAYAAKQPGDEVARLRRALSSAAVAERLARGGVKPSELRTLLTTGPVRTIDTDGKSVSSQSRVLVYALLLMLYMSILVYGAAASSAIVQEKASRVTEVMIARVTPIEHMAGKLGGLGLAALLQYAIWIATALLVLAGSSLAGASSGVDLAEVSPGVFLAFGAFFLLGFAFYGTLYAGLSAPASRTEDAAAAGALPGVLIVASFLASTIALGDPQSSLAQVLSFIPPLAPMTMFTRVALGSPPWIEVAASMMLLLASIALVLVLAAKVYRVGILLYGSKPTIRSVWRMARAS